MKTIRIPDEKINLFKKWFDESYYKFGITKESRHEYAWQINKPILETLFNIKEDRHPQWIRGRIDEVHRKQEIISAIANFGFDQNSIENSVMYFTRSFLPVAIHVDIPNYDINCDGNTIMIPLTFNDKIKTICWKGYVNEPIFDYWVEKQNWDSRKKLNNLTKQYDLTNGYFLRPNIVEYMELDGIGEWFKGSCFAFRRSQPHCSSNFKSSGIEYKDFIIIQSIDQHYGNE